MTSLDAICGGVSGVVMKSMLDDKHWRAFGYPKRPKRGRFFNAFIAANKLELENVLARELLAVSFAQNFIWVLKKLSFEHRIDFIARVMDICIGEDSEGLWQMLDFPNSMEEAKFLIKACKEYANTKSLIDQQNVFLNRCKKNLNQELPKAWIYGVSWLFTHPDSIIPIIIPTHEKIGTANIISSDISIRNKKYYDAVRELFD